MSRFVAATKQGVKETFLLLLKPLLAKPSQSIVEQQVNLHCTLPAALVRCFHSDLLSPASLGTPLSPGDYTNRLATAINRYRIFREEPRCKELLMRPVKGTGLQLLQASFWLENQSIMMRMPLPLRAEAFQNWWSVNAPESHREADRLLMEERTLTHSQPEESISFTSRPFGINLIGHAFDLSGSGEDARAIAASMRAAEIPFCVIDHPTPRSASHRDAQLADAVVPAGSTGPYCFNLVCTGAAEHARWVCEQGIRQLENRYTIVSWPWELERWPAACKPCLQIADEAWPYSSIIAKALSPYTSDSCGSERLRMTLMQPPAELSDAETFNNKTSRQKARSRFGLPQGRVLFVFSFDRNSWISRKNPMAAVKAFSLAFPPTDPLQECVGLVIKTHPHNGMDANWTKLKEAVENDPRITVIEASLTRSEVLSLYGCCDCFVSLHRSEGLGRGPAEALQLGLDVVVTDYSSTADFCTGALAHPVRYELIPVQPGEYVDHDRQVWADASIEHAAEQLREVARIRRNSPDPDLKKAAEYRQRLSYASAGERYRERLLALWEQRHSLASTLKANQITIH